MENLNEQVLKESDFRRYENELNEYKYYSKEIKISNLNATTFYFIKLEFEISLFLLSEEFTTAPYILTSNIVNFTTLEKSKKA